MTRLTAAALLAVVIAAGFAPASRAETLAAEAGAIRALLARRPDDPGALYQLGKLAALSGEELEQGLAHLDRYRAQKERPDDLPEFGGHWRRAQILEKLGRKDAAIAELRTATSLDPSAEGRARISSGSAVERQTGAPSCLSRPS